MKHEFDYPHYIYMIRTTVNQDNEKVHSVYFKRNPKSQTISGLITRTIIFFIPFLLGHTWNDTVVFLLSLLTCWGFLILSRMRYKLAEFSDYSEAREFVYSEKEQDRRNRENINKTKPKKVVETTWEEFNK